MSKVKEKVVKTTNETIDTTKRIINNFEKLAQAVSLLTVAGFSYYALKQLNLNAFVELIVTLALVVIGLRGAYEFVKFLDK